jgi:hypothetical protein
MFDPEKVLTTVWKRLSNDTELLNLLGIAVNDNAAKARQILRTSKYEDLAGSIRRLNIFFRPSRKTNNILVSEQVLEIDCHVPYDEFYMAYRILKRVNALVHKFQSDGWIFYYDSMLGELATAPNFFCASMRFSFYEVV